MSSIVYQRIGNLLIYLGVLILNGSGFTGSLEPTPPKLQLDALGASHPSILVPARYAFIVWLPIHLFQFLFILYQLLPRTYDLGFINSGITPLFCIHSISNLLWVTVYRLGQLPQYSGFHWLRIFFMAGIIVPLLLSYVRVNNRVAIDFKNRSNSNRNFYLNYWFGRVWLSFYLSWIIYAGSMDLFSFLDVPPTYYGYLFAKLFVIGILVLVLFIVKFYSDVVFALVYTWIMYWLRVKTSDITEEDDPRYQLYQVATVGGGIMFLVTLMTLFKNITFCVHRYQNQGLSVTRSPESRPILSSQENLSNYSVA